MSQLRAGIAHCRLQRGNNFVLHFLGIPPTKRATRFFCEVRNVTNKFLFFAYCDNYGIVYPQSSCHV